MISRSWPKILQKRNHILLEPGLVVAADAARCHGHIQHVVVHPGFRLAPGAGVGRELVQGGSRQCGDLSSVSAWVPLPVVDIPVEDGDAVYSSVAPGRSGRQWRR